MCSRTRRERAVDLRVGPDPGWVAATAADVIEAAVADRPDLVLGVATGSTPSPTYAELIRRGTDLSRAWVYLLDEYVGLPHDDPRTFVATINGVLDERVGMTPERVRAPDVWADDLAGAGRRYETEISERGGITLQILGIGRNGHIGFNEPGESFVDATHLVELSESTRRANAEPFGSPDDVPRRAVTQGIGTILRARSLLLLATGTPKRSALTAALEGPISEAVPASAVRLHPRTVVVADTAARGGAIE